MAEPLINPQTTSPQSQPPPPPQLAKSGDLSKVFGLCFGFPSAGALLLGDAPLPAGVAAPAWTPLQPTRAAFYTVKLLGLDVEAAQSAPGPGAGPPGGTGGRGRRRLLGETWRRLAQRRRRRLQAEPGPEDRWSSLPVDPSVYTVGYGTVMDSGTTFNYLPTAAFRALLDVIKGRLALLGVASFQQVGGACFLGSKRC